MSARGRLAAFLILAVGGALLFQSIGLRAWVVEGPTWSSSSVPFYVNPTNTNGLAADAVIAAFQTAASAWSSQSAANFSFNYSGTTGINTASNNGVNVAMFRPETYGSVAATTYWWSDSQNHLVTADVVIWENDFQYFTHATGCSTGLYVEDVATHEFGHALGLAHSTVPTATMYPNISSYCATDWETLDSDDIAGVESLYPPGSSPVQAPTAPSQLVVTVNSSSPSTSLVSSWLNSTNANGYRVERSSDAINFSQVAQLGSSTTSYADSGLTVGTTYYYRVSAYNGAGNSAYSNLASGQTQTASQQAPTAPSAPSSPSPSSGAGGVNTSVTLSWSASGATSYDVYFGTASTPGLYASNVTSRSLTVGSLTGGTAYNWFVVAKNSSGTTSGPQWWFTTKTTTKPGKGLGKNK